MDKKMDSVIDKMEEIIEREEPKEEEKATKIDEENIENLVRKIVFEAFDKSKVKPVVLETDDRDNLNALDAILENLFKESLAEDNEVEEKEQEIEKSNKPKAEKEEDVREPSEIQQTAVVTDELVDEIVERIFPLVSRLRNSNERDSDAEEIDDEVILIDNVKEEEDSIDVVHAALSAIIGDDPTEEQKLSPKVFAAVLELDVFLKEEEEERRQKEKKVDTLLSSALDFIDSAVGRREAAAARLGLSKRKKKKEKLDIEEVIAKLLQENN